MTPECAFQLNGRRVSLADADPTESLLRWLKRQHLTGTKEGCADGDCGACTVAMVELDAAGRAHYRAVNSCLLPMGLLPDREVLTVEALAEIPERAFSVGVEVLHSVQRALVDGAGSQCGYCTPGFVMSLFVAGHSGESGDRAIEGNLCRCTGYRPIRDAAVRLVAEAACGDRFQVALAKPRQPLPAAVLGTVYSPTELTEALALKARHPQAV